MKATNLKIWLCSMLAVICMGTLATSCSSSDGPDIADGWNLDEPGRKAIKPIAPTDATAASVNDFFKSIDWLNWERGLVSQEQGIEYNTSTNSEVWWHIDYLVCNSEEEFRATFNEQELQLFPADRQNNLEKTILMPEIDFSKYTLVFGHAGLQRGLHLSFQDMIFSIKDGSETVMVIPAKRQNEGIVMNDLVVLYFMNLYPKFNVDKANFYCKFED